MPKESFNEEDKKRAETIIRGILKEKETAEQFISGAIASSEQKNLALNKTIMGSIYDYDPRRPHQELEDLFRRALSEDSWLKEEIIEKLEETIQELKEVMIDSGKTPEEREQIADILERRRLMIDFLKLIKPKISK